MSTCTVCKHKKRAEIEEHLLLGTMSLRKMAVKYKLTTGPLSRHKRRCMSAEVESTTIIKKRPKKVPMPQKVRIVEYLTGEDLLGKLSWLIKKAEDVIAQEEKEGKGTGEKKGTDRRVILMAIDRIAKVSETYIKFMELAQKNDTDKELEEWKRIGTLIWEFIDKKGLREEFELELSRNGISGNR
jgi:hypothetical protein